MVPEFFEFYLPTRIISGAGLVDQLGQELERIGLTRGFLVTDQMLQKSGLVDRVLAGLQGSSVQVAGIFTEVVPNSEIGIVEKGAALARETRPDFILALGGGSVIDTAKGINILCSQGGNLLDYEGLNLVNEPLGPLVAIPTTAGTGSEVTQYAVIKDQTRQIKLTFMSPHLLPRLAVLDPEMTLGLPPQLTASTGLDALTHAVEACVSTATNPVAQGLGWQAARLISRYLPQATANGQDLEARHSLLVASSMAGMAFNSAMVGIVHAMAHACGGLYGVPHGLANAILLPHGMEYNLPVCLEAFGDLARAMGKGTRAALAIEAVQELSAACGLPRRLRDAGVPESGLASVAEAAALDGAIYTNPRPAEVEDILEILRRAY